MQSQEGAGNSWGSYYRSIAGLADSPEEGGRERGGRRKRITDFLKTANELRQSYTSGYTNRSAELEKEPMDGSGDQGNWPDIEVMKGGDEELVLFPCYARERPPGPQGKPSFQMNLGKEEDWWGEEQPTERDDNIVDVDVRGWLFAPHSVPLSRKNRYLIWVARQLCGLPVQASQAAGPTPAEAEATSKAAAPTEAKHTTRTISSSTELLQVLDLQHTKSTPTISANLALSSTQAEAQPDASAAHNALISRLAPFMHRPIPSVPITLFFYNSKMSLSRRLRTSDAGHFFTRVALPFMPTHIKVLASETLSANEKVVLHRAEGFSVISDIDDTVKHSAISMGAREMFRNTFTAPLPSLTIQGVADWYSKLAEEPYSANFHYISNSPWQLYPVLKEFFQEAGLPPGSMHLKQYSGMLQGIFEPVAERKKVTVERVIRDFPNRKWVLVGDSGEADLEVYTEVVQKFPGKVLGVFIRDVTSTDEGKGFFDADYPGSTKSEPLIGSKGYERKPLLPPPPPPRSSTISSVLEGDLLGLGGPLSTPRSESQALMNSNRTPPPRPPKPRELRGVPKTSSSFSPSTIHTDVLRTPQTPPPPLPRRIAATLEHQTRSPSPTQSQESLLSKKEGLWRRRWERAQDICEENGVILRRWKVGSDVEAECRAVVEEGLWGR
ncbi:unnamed protein product [Tuber melanosporum]|uniref:(Perigord truffle) hypothetical protein n=1 Tax=Tuber melanosporum (strain Mel28) TaxID=656061 RepID=D5GCK8_TUBMM|nr:uncharacterized protein GSTUM_00000700001 [Tuber melanosporum]CAZ82251.1 unnamed protein product [Tuber melanosporum]